MNEAVAYVRQHPELPYSQVAPLFGIRAATLNARVRLLRNRGDDIPLYEKPKYGQGRMSDEAYYARIPLRFMESVNKEGPTQPHMPTCCWEWTGKCWPNKYGSFFAARAIPETLAHRASYALFVGPIPKGLLVCHICDHRPCVRPDHLFLGNSLANMRDKVAKGRQSRPHGELCGKAKLTDEDVRAIRASAAEGCMQKDIAEEFQVSQKQISLIVNRKQWSHI